MTAIRVFLVDGHPIVLEGLAAVLERHFDIDVIGMSTSAESALVDLRRVAVDVVLLDACLPGMSGPDLCRQMREAMPAVRCLVLTGSEDRYLLRAAFDAEARGFLMKDVRTAEIADAIRAVHAGEMVLDPRATGAIVRELRDPPRPAVLLTAREQRLISCLAAGMSNPAIALEFRMSPNTVKGYVSQLLMKLDVASRTAAVARAATLGLLEVGRPESMRRTWA